MKSQSIHWVWLAAIAYACAVFAAGPGLGIAGRGSANPGPTGAPGKDLAAVWRGKTLTISVGYGPGGGADTMARLLAVHMPKFIPGNPRTLVANRPGGGTRTNARDMLRRPKDGTYFGQFAQTLMVADVVGQAPKWFEWPRYNYLGMVDGDQGATFSAMCGRRDKMRNLDEFVSGGPWTLGEISPDTGAGRNAVWFKLTGFPVRTFYGYGGSVEVNTAFDRGEMDVMIRCSAREAKDFRHWFERDFAVPLFGWGDLNPDNMVPRDNALRDGLRAGRWPWFCDMKECLAHLATKGQWAAFNALNDLGGTHVWALPPGVPNHIVKALQEAFWKTINSDAYRADMEKRQRVVAPLGGSNTRVRLQRLAELSGDGMEALRRMMGAK